MAVEFKDKHGDMLYGCACASTTYRKNILFKEPYPHVYYDRGDEVGAKEEKYSFTEVKMPSWKCTETAQVAIKENKCHYRFYHHKHNSLHTI